MNRSIGFITEANERIGYGHLYRCAAIAQILDEAGKTVIFFLDNKSETDTIRKILPNAIMLGKDSLQTYLSVSDKNLSHLILDVYPNNIFNFKFLEEVKHLKTVTIIDAPFAEKAIFTDLVFKIGFQEYQHKEETHRRADGKTTKHFSGNDYFIFRKEFFKDFHYQCKPDANRVLITMGGSDPYQLTEMVAKGMELIKKPLSLTYVLGGGFSTERLEKLKQIHTQNIHTISFQQNISNMAETMAANDIAIINGGNTRFELSRIGVPFFSLSINDKQDSISSFLEKKGIGISLGIFENIDTISISHNVKSLINNFSLRTRLSAKQKQLIKPGGNRKIYKEILSNG